MAVDVRFTGLGRSRDRELGKYRVMGAEVLGMFLVAFYGNVGNMQGILGGDKKKVYVRGGGTIAMVESWPWATDFG